MNHSCEWRAKSKRQSVAYRDLQWAYERLTHYHSGCYRRRLEAFKRKDDALDLVQKLSRELRVVRQRRYLLRGFSFLLAF